MFITWMGGRFFIKKARNKQFNSFSLWEEITSLALRIYFFHVVNSATKARNYDFNLKVQGHTYYFCVLPTKLGFVLFSGHTDTHLVGLGRNFQSSSVLVFQRSTWTCTLVCCVYRKAGEGSSPEILCMELCGKCTLFWKSFLGICHLP